MSDATNSQTDGQQEAARRALTQYQSVLGYLQYENSAYWTRSGFISVAQSALLGFYANLLVDLAPGEYRKKTTMVVISIAGLLLSLTWESVMSKGNWWIKRWIDVLLQLEETAFGETQVFRGAFEREDTGNPTNSNVVQTPVGQAERGLRWFPVIAAWGFLAVWALGLLAPFLV